MVNWLDLLLAVALVAGAIHGLQLGALVQVSSFAGFWVGFAVGSVIALPVAGAMHPGFARFAFTIVLVIGLSVLGGTIGRFVGLWSNPTMRKLHLGRLDSFVGAVVAGIAVLLSFWLVGSLLAQSSSTFLSSTIERSGVMRSLDTVMPPMPSVVSRVQGFLAAEGLQPVFANLPPVTAQPVALPKQAQAASIAKAASASVVKITSSACSVGIEGSGFLAQPGLVVTNAHVVAGSRSSIVQGRGWVEKATVRYYNPDLDIAVLALARTHGPVLKVSAKAAVRGDQGVVLGYPNNGGLRGVRASVAAVFSAAGRDIYGTRIVTREVEEIGAVVQPGNSGGPMVGTNGEVIGLVFSRSASSNKVGYALTMPQVLNAVRSAAAASKRVSTGACAPA